MLNDNQLILQGGDQPLLQRFLCEREVIAVYMGFGSRSAFRKEVAEGRFPTPAPH